MGLVVPSFPSPPPFDEQPKFRRKKKKFFSDSSPPQNPKKTFLCLDLAVPRGGKGGKETHTTLFPRRHPPNRQNSNTNHFMGFEGGGRSKERVFSSFSPSPPPRRTVQNPGTKKVFFSDFFPSPSPKIPKKFFCVWISAVRRGGKAKKNHFSNITLPLLSFDFGQQTTSSPTIFAFSLHISLLPCSVVVFWKENSVSRRPTRPPPSPKKKKDVVANSVQ